VAFLSSHSQNVLFRWANEKCPHLDATTLDITTPSVMTLSMTIKNATLSITTFGITIKMTLSICGSRHYDSNT
jgi:hypothetical protein